MLVTLLRDSFKFTDAHETIPIADGSVGDLIRIQRITPPERQNFLESAVPWIDKWLETTTPIENL